MEVKIVKWDVNWLEIKNLCRTTINRGDSNIEPTREWKRKMLLAQHSVLRHSMITIEFIDIPTYVSTHLCRHHEGVEKYVGTQRTDRTGVPREERKQTDPVTMRMDLNVQALLNISYKRLCMQADETTRALWEQVVDKVREYDPDIADFCVPEGIRSCGCTEGFGTCKRCPLMLRNLTVSELLDPERRYVEYNEQIKRLKRVKHDASDVKNASNE